MFPGQYKIDISMFSDLSTWCLQQYGLTIKFLRITTNIDNGTPLTSSRESNIFLVLGFYIIDCGV